jgi:hypothetical protein
VADRVAGQRPESLAKSVPLRCCASTGCAPRLMRWRAANTARRERAPFLTWGHAGRHCVCSTLGARTGSRRNCEQQNPVKDRLLRRRCPVVRSIGDAPPDHWSEGVSLTSVLSSATEDQSGADALSPSKGSARPVGETLRAETALTGTAVRNHQTRRSCPGCPSS